jgi:hypothetical protein
VPHKHVLLGTSLNEVDHCGIGLLRGVGLVGLCALEVICKVIVGNHCASVTDSVLQDELVVVDARGCQHDPPSGNQALDQLHVVGQVGRVARLHETLRQKRHGADVLALTVSLM